MNRKTWLSFIFLLIANAILVIPVWAYTNWVSVVEIKSPFALAKYDAAAIVDRTSVQSRVNELPSAAQTATEDWVVWETAVSPQSLLREGDTIWVGGRDSLHQWHVTAGYQDTYTTSAGLAGQDVVALALTGSGDKLVAALDGGLVRGNGSFSSLTPSTEPAWDLAVESDGSSFWLATLGNGVSRHDGTTWTAYDTLSSTLPFDDIYAVAVDSADMPWVGTVGYGVARFDGLDWITYTLPVTLSHPVSPALTLGNQAVNDIAIDSSGNKWFATDGSGVVVLDSTNSIWTVYNTSNSSLPDNFVYAITLDGDNRWFGTLGGGVARLDTSDNSWEIFSTTNSPLPDDDVLATAVDGSGGRWFATYDSGLTYYGPLPATPPLYDMEVRQPPKNLLSQTKAYSLWLDPSTYTWYLAWSGDGSSHAFTGSIVADGPILSAVPTGLEPGDTVSVLTNTLSISATEVISRDVVGFVLDRGVTELTIDLKIDGAYRPFNIQVGGNGTLPATAPFRLETPQPIAPQVAIRGSQVITEGYPLFLKGQLTDTDSFTGHQFAWDLGNGIQVTNTLYVPYTYTDNGTFNVTLIVTDVHQMVGSDNLALTVVNDPPDPFFDTFDGSEPKIGDVITFTGYVVDRGLADTHIYDWDFGDGFTQTGGVTATHVYTQPGVFTTTLTVTDDDGGVGVIHDRVVILQLAPTAVDDTAVTPEEVAVAVDVLANDTDPNGEPLTVAAVAQPTNGTTTINPNNTITYTPTLNFNGLDAFTYVIGNSSGLTSTARVTITVTPVNDAPTAVDDTATTAEDTAVDIDVLANDTDIDGDTLAVISTTQPINGVAGVNPDGTINYRPGADFNGTDSLTYTMSDSNGGTDTAVVTITVTPANDPPTAVDDTATTAEDTAVLVNVLLNDSDIDGDTITVTAVTPPLYGAAAIQANDTVVYTPTADFNGSDSFNYTIADGQGGTASATVTMTVIPVNDAPVAADDTAITGLNTAITIPVLANDSDIDNDPLTVVAVTLPLSGTAVVNPDNTITYTPTTNVIGEDTFTYTISDGNGGSDTAQVTVTVQPPSWQEVCQPANSQVEMIGTGMGHAGATTQNPAMLTIPDPGTVDFILAQVVLNNYTGTLPDKVIISSENETHELVTPTSSSGGFNYEVYLQPANQITAEVVGDGNPGDKTPRALILYLFRHDTGTIANSGRLVHEYVFEASHTQLLTIPTSTFARDVVVTFAVSDVDDDDRLLTLTAGAGSTSQSVDIIQPNRGDELLLYDVILPAVPGEVDTITTTLTSPSGGDSLYWSGINARVPCAEPVTGDRVTEGLQVLYTFQEGSGSTVHDVSGVGDAFDLVVDNPAAVTWLPDGGLSIDTPTVIQSLGAATKVVNTAQATNELTIEAWVKPANITQDGPARIVTLSPDGASHNFTIGQGQWAGLPADTFVGRLQTSEAQSELIPPAGTASTDLTHLVYTRDGAGVVRLYVDGVEVAADVAGGDLSSWDVGYPLSLGNEPTGDRPWRGQFHLVAFYNQALNVAEVQQNFAAGSGTTPPPPLPPGTRVTQNLQALYTFQEGSGITVADVSGVGSPLNLTISDETAVTWLAGGGLRTDSSVVISSGMAASKVITTARATDEVSVEMWVKPSNISQDGPARIVTISPDGTANNLTIGQGQWASLPKDVYIGRLRTDTAPFQAHTPEGTASTDLTHVVFTRNAEGEVHIYVDGVEVVTAQAAGDFSTWDLNYPLTLANEPTGDRPWRGELHLVAFYNRALSPEDVGQNFTAGSNLLSSSRTRENISSGHVPTALLSFAPPAHKCLVF